MHKLLLSPFVKIHFYFYRQLQKLKRFKSGIPAAIIISNQSLQRCINNIALSYLRAGITDSASFYQHAAWKIIEEYEVKYPANKNNILYSKAIIYGDQAEVDALRGKDAEAAVLYKKSIEGTSAYDVRYTQITQARLANHYLEENKIEPAHKLIGQLKISLDTSYNEMQLLSLQKLNVKYFTSIKKLDSAFFWRQQYTVTKDSFNARNKKISNVDLGKEFENVELKYSNDILQKESKLKNLHLLISISVFLMVLLYLYGII